MDSLGRWTPLGTTDDSDLSATLTRANIAEQQILFRHGHTCMPIIIHDGATWTGPLPDSGIEASIDDAEPAEIEASIDEGDEGAA